MRKDTRLLYVLFFFSGASSLIYQIAWIRMFGLVFGVSAFAIATVLASFMAGLGFGNFYFGKIAARSARPLHLYALLELGIGLYGLIFPFLFSALKLFCQQLPAEVQNRFLVISLVRLLFSLLVLAVPTALMGGTLPVLSKIFVKDLRTLGKRIAGLYSVNNAGAIAGCLAAGFLLMLLVGVHGTVLIAAGVNLVIAFLAWILDNASTAAVQVGEKPGKAPALETQSRSFFTTPVVRLVLVLIGIEGFVSLAYELVWTRILSAAVLGNSVYSYCIVTAVFICGLSLGSFLTSIIIDKRKDALGFFAGIEIAIGLSAIVFLLFFCKVPGIEHARMATAAFGVWGRSLAQDLFFSIVVMLIPATLMGMAFPTAVRICTPSIVGVSRTVGIVGGLNTFGSIAGSLAGGFILIPMFGMYRSVIVLALVNIMAGVVAIMFDTLLHWRLRTAVAVTFAAACACMPAVLPHHALYWRSTAATSDNEWLHYYVEDYAATVAVVNSKSIDGDVACLEVDGIPVAGTEYMLRTTQKAQAHIPLLLYESQNHGPAGNVLTVGLGSGGTSWSATQHDIGSITCVELVPGVVKAAEREFSEENHDVFGSTRFHLIIGDGRNHVLTTAFRYDVILTESVHPIYAGNASLYTQDYFRACRGRLTENGVFSVWLPIYRLSRGDLKTVMATFVSVFPHASVWFTTNSLSRQVLLIGTMKKLEIDFATWVAMVNEPKVRKDLRQVRLDDPLKLLDCMIMTENDMRNFAAGAAIHTDDHPVLEFSAPKSSDDFVTWKRNLAAIAGYKKSSLPFLVNCTDSAEARRLMAQYDAADRHILTGLLNHFDNQDGAVKEYRLAQRLNPSDNSIGYLVSLEERSMLNKAHGLQSVGNIGGARALYKIMLDVDPGNFSIVNEAALWYGRLHVVDAAESLLTGYVRTHPGSAGADADAYASLGIVYVNNRRWGMALTVLDSALLLNPRLAEAYNTRAIAYAGEGLYDEALASLDKAIEMNPETPNAYENRAYVYAHMGKNDLAEKDAALSRSIRHGLDSGEIDGAVFGTHPAK
jgi:spermidine synthase